MNTTDCTYFLDPKANAIQATCAPDIMAMYFSGRNFDGVFSIPAELWKIIARRMKADGYVLAKA